MHIPHTIGFDISVKKACELFFDSGKGAACSTEAGAGTDHSFNFTQGKGTHHFCIIARKLADNEKIRPSNSLAIEV